MTFSATSYDPASPTNVQRWVDDTRQWYLSVERVAFGYRVQLQRQAAPYPYPEVILAYCAGPHRAWVEALVTVLRASLRDLDPALTTSHLLSRYPNCDVKPMASDGKCWRALCQLAGLDYTRPVEELGEVEFDYRRAHLVGQYLLQITAGVKPAHARQILDEPFAARTAGD